MYSYAIVLECQMGVAVQSIVLIQADTAHIISFYCQTLRSQAPGWAEFPVTEKTKLSWVQELPQLIWLMQFKFLSSSEVLSPVTLLYALLTCNYPARMRDGKAIGTIRRLSAQKSPDLDIWAVCKHNQTVETAKTLPVSTSNRIARPYYKSCVFPWPRAYQPHL